MADSPDPETRKLEEELEIKKAQQRAMERQARVRAAYQRAEKLASEEDEGSPERAEAIDQLHEAFMDAAIEWLEGKWGSKECPYCGVQDWGVSIPFNLLLESRRTLAPHFSAMCGNCGNTVFVNAILAGLFPPDEQ